MDEIKVELDGREIFRAAAPSNSPTHIDSLFRESMNRSREKYIKAQKWLDNKVLEDTKPFLPSTLSGVQEEGTDRIMEPAKIELHGRVLFKETAREALPLLIPDVDRAIFSPPATIAYWTDGTKTVVKCGADDVYSKETGVALCFMKKALGNKGNYNEVLKRLIGG